MCIRDRKRTANYGSKHYNEKTLSVDQAKLLPDGKTVSLSIPNIEPTWGMEISYTIKTESGQPFTGKIHNSIFRLAKP